VQRRHQKLIEESPSTSITPETRKAMCESARRLIQASNYTNAATVEFIVDRDGNYYFIEVNARIQVEHPVTEMVTGIDLTKQQIRIASGEPLPFKQEDIVQRGAAIECRINAEDPQRKFQPSPGKIERLIAPGGFGVRWDSHAHSGYVVPPYYDSMIGKLIVHQPTREQAVRTMLRALAEMRVEGIKTVIPLHQEILSHSAFADGRIDTTFVERTFVSE
jgi:acetyl-CoA carboxylase biotin carboxylase subunit